MAELEQSHTVAIDTLYIPSAQLIVGPSYITHSHTITYLQRVLCLQNGCTVCSRCRAIADQNYHAVTWIAPEERYTLEHLAPITTTLLLGLDAHQHHFFIIHHADYLTAACANSLLKSIEEPPAGYHFIFLARRPELVLPTVRSRCLLVNVQGSNAEIDHPLCAFFRNPTIGSPAAFLKILESSKPTEQETAEILDTLLTHWLSQSKTVYATTSEVKKSPENRIKILTALCKRPIMPGSSKLIWRQLYLNLVV